MNVSRSKFRIAAATLTFGLAFAGVTTPAMAQEVPNIGNKVTEALGELLPGGSNTATHQWSKSNVTRTVLVNGKAGAVAKPGDTLTFELVYTDNNIWGSRSYIQRVTDFKPEGLKYVPNSATYKVGDEDWADKNTSDKWFRLNKGAVEFVSGNIFRAFGSPTISKVAFKWEYEVTEDIQDGTFDTGTEIHFNPFDKVETLDKMGPKLTIKREAKPILPGLPELPGAGSGGSWGSPNLNSPGLPSPNLGGGSSAGSPNLGSGAASLLKAFGN